MSSDDETPSFRARESAWRSSGSRRTVVRRFDAIQTIYINQAPMVKSETAERSELHVPDPPGQLHRDQRARMVGERSVVREVDVVVGPLGVEDLQERRAAVLVVVERGLQHPVGVA